MAIFTRANSNPHFQPPGFNPNPQYPNIDVGATLDSVYDAYMRSRQDERAGQLNALQVQQAQGAIDAQKSEAALRNAKETDQFGAPLASYSQQQISQASVAPRPAFPGASADFMGNMVSPAPFNNDMNARLGRLREGLAKLGGRDQATLDAQAATRQKESVGLDLTRSQIAENNAQAAKLQADVKLEATGGGSKRPAATEFTARGFADKAKQANDALEAVVAGGYQPSKMANILEGMAPVGFQSANFQQADQARRQFVNAVLRRESGAAIPPSELENYTRQYFPVPGDSPAVLQQKAAARQLAIANLEQEGARVPSAIVPKAGRQVGRFVVEEG